MSAERSEGPKGVNEAANRPRLWTAEEDELLFEEFQQGLSMTLIAERHERSLGAIRSRLLHLGIVTPRHRRN